MKINKKVNCTETYTLEELSSSDMLNLRDALGKHNNGYELYMTLVKFCQNNKLSK